MDEEKAVLRSVRLTKAANGYIVYTDWCGPHDDEQFIAATFEEAVKITEEQFKAA